MSTESITYASIDDGDILIRTYHKTLDFEESIMSWQDIIDLKVCDKHPKGVISDFSTTGVVVSVANVAKLLEYIDRHIDFFSGIISAAVVQHPDKTASGELVKEGIADKNMPFQHELYFSLDNALRWMRTELSLRND